MRRILYSLITFFILSGSVAYAYSDFYGIKMKDPNCASDFVLEGGGGEVPKYSLNRDTMDDRISATGQLEYFFSAIKSIHIKVMNRSDKPIRTDLTFASIKLIATDDQEYEMVQPDIVEYPAVDMINPKDEATFVIPMVRLQIKKEEIKMIICSFDVGETKIILLPRPSELAKPATPLVTQPAAKSKPEAREVRTSPNTFINTGKGSKTVFVENPGPDTSNFALPKSERRVNNVR